MNKDKDLTIEETFRLAVTNHAENNIEVAQNLYKEVLKIDSNYAPAHNNLGVIFKKLEENYKAIDCYEKAIKVNPYYVDAHFNLGTIFKKLKENKKAIDCYEKVIKINPKHINAYNGLGLILKETDDSNKAINCYKKIIEIDPKHVNAHNNLGGIFNELGDYKKAIYWYEKTIEIDPNHEITLYNLGVALHSIQEYKKAAEQFKLINFKNSKSFLLSCFYNLGDKSTFFKKLDDQIKQGEVNAIIGSLSSLSEIRYGIRKSNPFCGEPLKYSLKTNLAEKYDFKDIFVDPIKYFLKHSVFSTTHQDLLINGHQTKNNLFDKKDYFLDRIKDIIHLEVEKYQNHFKESKEGFIKSWPKSYNINAWLVSMESGGKLNPHIHDYGWLSGSIYINVPPKLKTNSGNLVVCINNQVIKAEKDSNLKKIIDVVTGDLCLFPSSLYHYTVPFESNEERVVLAFDVMPN